MHSYTVRSGDTLSAIAQRQDVSLQEMIAANPQIADPNLIHPGQVLEVPDHRDDTRTPSAPSTRAPKAIGVAPNEPAPTPAASYIVVSGDTMSGIAARHGVSLAQLVAANPQITDPNRIYPEQMLIIPGGTTPARPAPAVGGSTYTVVSGDTMSGIAARHGVSLARLIAANPQITNANLIYPGQVLTLPSDASASTPPPIAPVGPPSGSQATDIDALINEIAASLGIEAATARAVLQVESSGSGFVDGKLKIRFESHIFSGYASPAVAANHNGQSGEWSAFEAALAVNREAAFKSISMGAGQIMGFNHARVGYPSAEAMFNAFADPQTGAAAQIKAMFDFIASNPDLLRAAQRKDWATFARYYNGAGYMNHTPPYDERLRNAYASWANA